MSVCVPMTTQLREYVTMLSEVTPASIMQVGLILNSIADLASAVEQLACQRINDEGVKSKVAELMAIQSMAQQIGWFADLGAEKIGAGASFGDAEYWSLPPAYHEYENANKRTKSEVANG